MSRKPNPAQPAPTDAPLKERRAGPRGPGAASPLKRLKGALARPVRLEWREGQPHVVLVERRKGPRLDRAQAHMCAELRARLLAQGADETSKLLRYLVVVHETITRKGWDGVGALPSAVLTRAIKQADMLAREEPSPALTQLSAHLAALRDGAVERERAKKAAGTNGLDRVEITEASYKEFEEAERSWSHTMPSDLAPLHSQA